MAIDCNDCLIISLPSQAVPEDTSNVVGAAGSIETCTAQGWLNLMFSQSVAVYYASLGVYSFFAIKNSFKQESFRWIEKWIHLAAFVFPFTLCTVVTAHKSFNPRGTGCFIAASPYLCEKVDEEECERGGTLSDVFIGIFAFGNIILYLIVPPLAMMLIGCWIKRTIKEAEQSVGMRQIIVSARKNMMQDLMKQIGLYLLAFWLTYICPMANGIVEAVTGAPLVNLMIIGNCMSSLQGAILTAVYFPLQRMTSGPKRLGQLAPGLEENQERRKDHLTVSKIRSTAESREAFDDTVDDDSENQCAFFIFDGTPTEDSPWAIYFVDEDNEENQ